MNIIRSDEVENLTSIIQEDELSVMLRDLEGNSCKVCGNKDETMYVEIQDKESFSPLEMTVDDLKLVCKDHREEVNEDFDDVEEDDIVIEDGENQSFEDYYGGDVSETEDNEDDLLMNDDKDDPLMNDNEDDISDSQESVKEDEGDNKHNIFVERSISSVKYGLLTILTFILTISTGAYIIDIFNSYIELLALIPILLGSLIYGSLWDLRYHKKIDDEEKEGAGLNITLLLFTSLVAIGSIVLYGLDYLVIESLLIIGITNILITYNLENISKYDTVELIEDNILYLVDDKSDNIESEISRVMDNKKDDLAVINKYKAMIFRYLAHVGGFAGLVTVFILSADPTISYVFIGVFLINPLLALIYMIYRTRWYNKFVEEEE